MAYLNAAINKGSGRTLMRNQKTDYYNHKNSEEHYEDEVSGRFRNHSRAFQQNAWIQKGVNRNTRGGYSNYNNRAPTIKTPIPAVATSNTSKRPSSNPSQQQNKHISSLSSEEIEKFKKRKERFGLVKDSLLEPIEKFEKLNSEKNSSGTSNANASSDSPSTRTTPTTPVTSGGAGHVSAFPISENEEELKKRAERAARFSKKTT